MTAVTPTDVTASALPLQALTEWLTLAALVDEIETVPWRASDAEAGWPDRKQLDAPSTGLAVAGCWRCPGREACLAYALAADESEGIWAGPLPAERRAMQRRAATGAA
jgi:hypothetical protein